MTFHQRAKMLKALGDAIMARKEELYALSAETGATRSDSWIDIEGGAGTLSLTPRKGGASFPTTASSSTARRRLCRNAERSSACTSTPRCKALQSISMPLIFPVWRNARAARPHTLLAGVPARSSSKPATATAKLAKARVRHHDGCEGASRRRRAAHHGQRRRPVRSPERPGRRVFYRLGRDRRQAQEPSHHHPRRRAIHRRAGFAQCVRARPGCDAREPGVRSVRQGSRARDDGEGGTEMHRHPPRLCAGRADRRRRDRVEGWPLPGSGRRWARS